MELVVVGTAAVGYVGWFVWGVVSRYESPPKAIKLDYTRRYEKLEWDAARDMQRAILGEVI